jgi:N-acetylglucosaminyl-diphospho-decaprenol L-rhamnosyltransferase
MSTRQVTVIIVTYKTAQLAIDCLRSINAERHQPDLVITATVVDNSSEDYDAIKQASDHNGWSDWVQLVCPPKNGGFAYGNNFGVRLASEAQTPDYIHLLNPDTMLRKGAIASLVQFLEAHEEIGIAGSSFENLDGSDWPFAFRFPTILSEIEEGLQFGLTSKFLMPWVVARTMGKSPERVDWIPGASMMIRRSVFDAVGGLDEHYFLYFEETDFCFRANQHGFQTWYVPESRVMHIAGQSTKVTEREAKTRRLPPYWFESRRRFFVTSYGLSYAVLTDICAVIARSLGAIKRFCLRQRSGGVPHYLNDLLRYSALWPRNRRPLRSI